MSIQYKASHSSSFIKRVGSPRKKNIFCLTQSTHSYAAKANVAAFSGPAQKQSFVALVCSHLKFQSRMIYRLSLFCLWVAVWQQNYTAEGKWWNSTTFTWVLAVTNFHPPVILHCYSMNNILGHAALVGQCYSNHLPLPKHPPKKQQHTSSR